MFNFGLNGKKLWEYTAFEEEDSYEPYIETAVIENVIYGKSSKAMFALDFEGKEKWMKKTGKLGSDPHSFSTVNKITLSYLTVLVPWGCIRDVIYFCG